MPIDYKKYPPDWKETRERILKRAGNRCEDCCLDNGAIGYREKDGRFIEVENSIDLDLDEPLMENGKPAKIIKIVLTIAHLDHDEENHTVTDDRLKALCQRCHLRYDVKEKKQRRFHKKHKDQIALI